MDRRYQLSRSSILGNFLIYLESEPGLLGDAENKKAIRRTLVATTTTGSKPTGIRRNREATALLVGCDIRDPGDYERLCLEDQELYGQNIHSHSFKPDGLVKKTITDPKNTPTHRLADHDKRVRANLESKGKAEKVRKLKAKVLIRKLAAFEAQFRVSDKQRKNLDKWALGSQEDEGQDATTEEEGSDLYFDSDYDSW
ncbi:hypothetical protein GE09DRAFT_1196866 [Coniochaeta sp. 2T2.1]|nr:hypothetical protein GE09DRAFT_1196866 [Coniochaeta sp. 2T2.1]